MKTRNAFWLRDFDAERILQRRYFKDFQFGEKPDAEILADLLVKDDDDISAMEEKVHALKNLHNRLKQFNDKIVRYIEWHNRNKIDVWIETISANIAVVELMKKIEKQFYEVEKATQERYKKIFTERLRKYRKAAGLTQKKLGELVLVSPRGMARYISGEREVPTHTLIRLAKILNVTADKLLGIET